MHSSFACFFGSEAVRELPRSRWHSAHVVFAFLPASGAFTCTVQPYGIREILRRCTPLATYVGRARAQGHSATLRRARVLSASRLPWGLFLPRTGATVAAYPRCCEVPCSRVAPDRWPAACRLAVP